MSTWQRNATLPWRTKSSSNSRSRSSMTERRRECGVCWNFS